MVNKVTSKRVATKAGQLLRTHSTPKVKSVAGSALSQKTRSTKANTISPKPPRSRNRSKH